MKNRQIAFTNNSKRQSTKPINYLAIGNGVFVIPYSLISGAVNLSEKGIETSTGVYITDPASFLQMVFTGKDAINVCWDGSTYFTPNTTNTNQLDYNFQVGDYFYGKPVSGSVEGGAEISQVEGNDDFLAMKSSQTITVQFEYDMPITGDFYLASVANHHLVANDLYKRKLYRIPQIGENKWFYISNAQPVYHDQTGKIIGTIVTFDTVLDKLQSSGRAVEQYVQNGAPGEPRAVPKLEYEWDESGISGVTLTLDEYEKHLDQKRLIRYVQTELQGAGGYCGCMVYGRRLTETNGVITTSAWKHLLPYDFYQFNTNPINKTSVPSSTYNFIPNYKLSMNITNDWIDSWKKVQDSLSTCQCAGRIYLGVDSNWDGAIASNGVAPHKSNLGNKPYWDTTWLPMGSGDKTIPPRTSIDFSGSPYTSNTGSFLANDTFKSLFIKNTFLCMNNPQLPVDINFSKPYHLSNLPIIGRLFAPWIGDRTLFPNKTSIEQQGIGMFIDKSYLNQLIGIPTKSSQTGDIYGFLSSLGGEMIPKGFGATSYNTSMCWKLTDILGDGKDTILLGQRKYEDGTWIDPTNHTPYTLNCNNVITTQESSTGYVIDRIVLFSEFSGNVRFSFYNKDMRSQYATTIISSTKFLDNSYNNYMTMVNFGTWPEEYIDQSYDPTWPENYGNVVPANISFTQFNNYNSTSVNPSTSQPITQLQGTWNHTYTENGMIGDLRKLINNKFTKVEQIVKTFNYDELGLADVTDRDTLITNYQDINLYFVGTLIKARLTDRNWQQQISANWSPYDIGYVTLQTGVYEYEKTIPLFGVNSIVTGKSVGWDGNFLSLNHRQYTGHNENSWFLLRYTQKMKIKIELLSTYIQITADDMSEITQANPNDYITEPTGSPVQPSENGWCPAWYLNDRRHIENFNSKTQLKYLDFIKR